MDISHQSKNTNRHPTVTSNLLTSSNDRKGQTAQRLTVDEEKVDGAVSAQVYMAYLDAALSRKLLIAFIVSAIFGQVCQVGSNFFLAGWSCDPTYK